MLHEMYDAILCVFSMFITCGCNVCACKLICCFAEENKSLTAEENKSLTAEDMWILHVLKLAKFSLGQ